MTGILLAYLTRWHGRGADEQADYYRCRGCLRIVTWHAIRKGGCPCGISNKLSPARLSLWEKARLLMAPWWCVR